MKEQIELHPAWAWDCQSCGRENFERTIVAELTDAEKLQAFRATGDLEDWQTLDDLPQGLEGSLQTYPDEVRCKHCSAVYVTMNERE